MFSSKNTIEEKKSDIDEAANESKTQLESGNQPAAPTSSQGEFTARTVSFIGPGLNVSGELSVDESLYIEGNVEGTITTQHDSLTIGKKGHIDGDIIAQVLEVRGTVTGEIYSHQLVRLYSSAVVDGNIHSKRLIVDEGATFNGKIDMNWDGTVPGEKSTLTSVEVVETEEEKSVVRVAG